MAGWRRPIELAVNEVEVAALEEISRSRSEPAIRVERARILLAYRESLSFFAVGSVLGVHHQTVQRCVERAAVEGPMAALDERPRPGKAPSITAEAKAWIKDLACRKAKELGYPHELWTTRLLASHARKHGPAEGHGCLAKLAQGTLPGFPRIGIDLTLYVWRSYWRSRRDRPSHHGTLTGLSNSPEARTMGRWARRWNR